MDEEAGNFAKSDKSQNFENQMTDSLQKSENFHNSSNPNKSDSPKIFENSQKPDNDQKSDNPKKYNFQKSDNLIEFENPAKSDNPKKSDNLIKFENQPNSDNPQKSDNLIEFENSSKSENPPKSDNPQKSDNLIEFENPPESDNPQKSETLTEFKNPPKSDNPKKSDNPQKPANLIEYENSQFSDNLKIFDNSQKPDNAQKSGNPQRSENPQKFEHPSKPDSSKKSEKPQTSHTSKMSEHSNKTEQRHSSEEPALLRPSEPLSCATPPVRDADIFPSTVEEHYVLAIDVGTSCIRGNVYDHLAQIKGTSSRQQCVLQPEPGWYEIDPHKLVQDFCLVAKESISAAGLQPDQITCMGITTLRASFLTWDRETGEPFHNIITWQDLRAIDYVYEWNRSYKLFALNATSKILYRLFGKKHHQAASVLKFMSKQVSLRLLWVFDHIPQIRARASVKQVMFGCTETWLLWNLLKGHRHVTDYSCASATGLYDPFQMEWSTTVCRLLNIPMSMFPAVKDTSGDFGMTDPDVCGFQIPVTAVVADQQGSMFGHCCFDRGDVKCSMGTGTFLNLNTGSRPHATLSGLYPVIGWKIGQELVYLAEGQSADTGIVIEWAKNLGLCKDVAESSDLAESVPDSGGVFFVPAFSGLQAPYNDEKAATAIFGMTPNTTKAHFVRAVLESLAFQFKSLYEMALTETRLPFSHIRVDGGVAANNFLVQMMSDVVDQVIEQSLDNDLSCVGAAFLAGLSKGVWISKEELKDLRQNNKRFEPRYTWPKNKISYHHWENAVHRSRHWYPGSQNGE